MSKFGPNFANVRMPLPDTSRFNSKNMPFSIAAIFNPNICIGRGGNK